MVLEKPTSPMSLKYLFTILDKKKEEKITVQISNFYDPAHFEYKTRFIDKFAYLFDKQPEPFIILK